MKKGLSLLLAVLLLGLTACQRAAPPAADNAPGQSVGEDVGAAASDAAADADGTSGDSAANGAGSAANDPVADGAAGANTSSSVNSESAPAPDPYYDPEARVLPWQPEEGPPLPDAETYFATEQVWACDDEILGRNDPGPPLAYSCCTREELPLYLLEAPADDPDTQLWFIDRSRPVDWMTGKTERPLWPLTSTTARDCAYDQNFVYAFTEDGTRLLQIDWLGKQERTLYTDADGGLRQAWRRDAMLFFTASAGQGKVGMYRLYLPDGSVKLLCDQLPLERPEGPPWLPMYLLGTERLCWEEETPAFAALRQAEKVPLPYMEVPLEYIQLANAHPDICPVQCFYHNALTGETLRAQRDCRSWFRETPHIETYYTLDGTPFYTVEIDYTDDDREIIHRWWEHHPDWTG